MDHSPIAEALNLGKAGGHHVYLPVVLSNEPSSQEGGAYEDDENTLIFHDRELARACYAEWQRLWATVPAERVCNAVRVYLPVMVSDYASP